MATIKKKSDTCLSPHDYMRQQNRIEALSSFGISPETIKEIDKKMALAGKKYKEMKKKENIVNI